MSSAEPKGTLSSISSETMRLAILALDPKEVIEARFGPRVAKKLHGVFLSQPRADAPLCKVYIDNTQIDCYISITHLNGETYLVRPWLILVSDDNTGRVLGFALSFRTPTAGDILAALRHAILPKTYTEKWVGNSLKLSWDVFGIPDEIVLDNGLDLQAYAVDAACDALAINVTTTPPMEPWTKARKERLFGTLNTKLFHKIPGTTFGSTQNKKTYEYNPQDFACLTLEELLEVMHITFEELACSFHEGIRDIPIRRWREGVRRFPVRMPASLLEFDVQMSLRVARRIGKLGIQSFGLYYADDALVELKRKLGGSSSVIVHFKPEDIRQAYVVDPTSQRAIVVSCTNHFDEPLPLYLHLERRKGHRDLLKPSTVDQLDDADYDGARSSDSLTRLKATNNIIQSARERRSTLKPAKAVSLKAQTAALSARHDMERPGPTPKSKEASVIVGRNILGAGRPPSDSNEGR